jgi:5-methylcytosine-specific restriction enzyme A
MPRPRPKVKARPSSTQQGYNALWAMLSLRVRTEEPICRTPRCGRASEHTDHIDGDRTNWERWNLQALCRPCHSSKTARHDGGFGNKKTAR